MEQSRRQPRAGYKAGNGRPPATDAAVTATGRPPFRDAVARQRGRVCNGPPEVVGRPGPTVLRRSDGRRQRRARRQREHGRWLDARPPRRHPGWSCRRLRRLPGWCCRRLRRLGHVRSCGRCWLLGGRHDPCARRLRSRLSVTGRGDGALGRRPADPVGWRGIGGDGTSLEKAVVPNAPRGGNPGGRVAPQWGGRRGRRAPARGRDRRSKAIPCDGGPEGDCTGQPRQGGPAGGRRQRRAGRGAPGPTRNLAPSSRRRRSAGQRQSGRWGGTGTLAARRCRGRPQHVGPAYWWA